MTPTRRVYSNLLNPREHPDDPRRAVRPPDWTLFGGITHFTSLRSFLVKDHRIVDFEDQLEKYTRTFDLGDVIWPFFTILFAENLGDLADAIKRRSLFLFDIWGYVAGSGPVGEAPQEQFKPPTEVLALLKSRLGECWLGMDNGEQDGIYVGGWASQMEPRSAPRLEQYLNFHRHLQRLTDDLGNRMSTLVSLNYGHYFLKEGVYTLIGAETAQALPNGQVQYAFIRGAGKQYGVPWFGNASYINRWGYKTYSDQGADHGPLKGTSLSLLKRLLYSHILYNCMLVGYEGNQLTDGELSPIGLIQKSAKQWVHENGTPGVMLAPIAVMVDFYSGWTYPRHDYTGDVYRIWGNLPYEQGDRLTDLVLGMLYPGYEDSSYFHDESGFLTATPYGGSADCLLSDAPEWLLKRYAVLVVTGDLTPGEEIRDKLRDYALRGGQLVVSATNAAQLGDLEDAPVTVIPDIPDPPPDWESHITHELLEDKPLPKPYHHLRPKASTVLDRIFREQMLFEAGEGLSLITCRRAPGEYTLGIANNSYSEKPFRIKSHCGPIKSIDELPLDTSEMNAPGYLPEGLKGTALGANSEHAIAGGDIRIFRVHVREQGIEEVPHVTPPPRPQGRTLPLRGISSIEEAVLSRPTFFQHFDGIAVDWRYIADRERVALGREGAWILQQNVRVVVDLGSGVNLYPDLRLVDSVSDDYVSDDYQTSMNTISDVISKMPLLGARDLVLSLHRRPGDMTEEETWAGFERSVRELCRMADTEGITVLFRRGIKFPYSDAQARDFVKRVGASNLRVADRIVLDLDGLYKDKDEEYRAVRALEEAQGSSATDPRTSSHVT